MQPNKMAIFMISGAINFSDIRQWQLTLFIFNGIGLVVKIFLDLFQAGMDSWVPPTIIALTMGIILITGCKNYLEDFVKIDKI